jgi:hypothetical protein
MENYNVTKLEEIYFKSSSDINKNTKYFYILLKYCIISVTNRD